MNNENRVLQDFADKQNLLGITEHTLDAIVNNKPGYSVEKAQKFIDFHNRIKSELLQHSIITNNNFTKWFSQGEMSETQLQGFVVQFSVFSNLFLVAQLLKTINANGLESMRSSKEILVNELGVVYKSVKQNLDSDSIESPDGSIEGGTYHFRAAHFEWLLQLAISVGLKFNDVGKRRHGNKSTLFFCDELNRLYASEDYTVSQASSFAVENWAAAGFWKELIEGLTVYQKKHNKGIPLFFFTRHDEIEAQHAKHTLDELEDIYFNSEIDEELFISSGNEILNAVEIFWNGLDDLRKTNLQ